MKIWEWGLLGRQSSRLLLCIYNQCTSKGVVSASAILSGVSCSILPFQRKLFNLLQRLKPFFLDDEVPSVRQTGVGREAQSQ